MAASGRRHLWRRMRTASGLPGRVVAVEDQANALALQVGERLEEVRHELGEIRRLLDAMNQADAEAVELTGRLLRASEARLDALEEKVGWSAREVALPPHLEVPSA